MTQGSPPELLVANVGGEEGERTGSTSSRRRAEVVARLWRELFEPPRPFAWLEGEAFAWLNTPEAEGRARECGRVLEGAAPEVVRRAHDKAFALEVARRERLEPACLRELAVALEPAELIDAERARARIESVLVAWPEWARRRFTLKPRFASSGRGRVAGRGATLDAALCAALPRLAERGGAILEPWLERRVDFSTQLHLGEAGAVTLLGTLEARVTPAGLVRGHRGVVDSRGRASADSLHEDALLEAALCVAGAAAAAGYRGPCGVDAFAFADPTAPERTLLRPVVEFNARFTVGTLALGGLRRHLSELKRTLDLRPGRRLPFALLLEARSEARGALPPDALWIALGGEAQDATAPALLAAREVAVLERLLSAAAPG